jgi:hypothetical protein
MVRLSLSTRKSESVDLVALAFALMFSSGACLLVEVGTGTGIVEMLSTFHECCWMRSRDVIYQ